MEGRGFNALRYRPFDGTVKYGFVVMIHTKDKTAVAHHPQVMKALDGGVVIAVEVLMFTLLQQTFRIERLEADEQAAQSGINRFFQQTGFQYRLQGSRRLPQSPHAAHSVKQSRR